MDELRVMEIFEGSPAEKAALSKLVDESTCAVREIFRLKFPKFVFDSSGGKKGVIIVDVL